MAVYTSAAEMAKARRARAGNLNDAIRRTVDKAADIIEQEATVLTSGTISSATLAALGHPYSRARPGSLPRLPINKQSGDLQRSARFKPFGGAGYAGFSFSYAAEYAKYILSPTGTKRMVARPFFAELVKRARPRLEKMAVAEWRLELRDR